MPWPVWILIIWRFLSTFSRHVFEHVSLHFLHHERWHERWHEGNNGMSSAGVGADGVDGKSNTT